MKIFGENKMNVHQAKIDNHKSTGNDSVSGKLPKREKAIVIGMLHHFIDPFEPIPDITPFLGFSNDF